jgi:hypothetical protein
MVIDSKFRTEARSCLLYKPRTKNSLRPTVGTSFKISDSPHSNDEARCLVNGKLNLQKHVYFA